MKGNVFGTNINLTNNVLQKLIEYRTSRSEFKEVSSILFSDCRVNSLNYMEQMISSTLLYATRVYFCDRIQSHCSTASLTEFNIRRLSYKVLRGVHLNFVINTK